VRGRVEVVAPSGVAAAQSGNIGPVPLSVSERPRRPDWQYQTCPTFPVCQYRTCPAFSGSSCGSGSTLGRLISRPRRPRPGDRIAAAGAFLIDAETRLNPSLRSAGPSAAANDPR
jgi:hypothetical protein